MKNFKNLAVCRLQPTLKIFNLEADSRLSHNIARDSILENNPFNTLDRPSEIFGAN